MDIIDNKKDRIYAKNLFLKYENCPKTWTKEFVKTKLVDQTLIYKLGPYKYKTKVKGWLIAQNEDNFYCLIELDKITDVGNERDLDILDVKATYESAKNNFFTKFKELQKYDHLGEGLPGL